MPSSERKTGYSELVNRHAPPPSRERSQEDNLDALLSALEQKKGAKARAGLADVKTEPLDDLRRMFREQLIPGFGQLAEKYAEKGIELSMDAGDLLNGGRKVLVEASFDVYRLKLDGTAVPEGVAFQETRYSNNVQGELASGPMLRARGLTADRFRDFVCDRVSLMVRAAIRKH